MYCTTIPNLETWRKCHTNNCQKCLKGILFFCTLNHPSEKVALWPTCDKNTERMSFSWNVETLHKSLSDSTSPVVLLIQCSIFVTKHWNKTYFECLLCLLFTSQHIIDWTIIRSIKKKTKVGAIIIPGCLWHQYRGCMVITLDKWSQKPILCK